jgi:hypothetical protein
LYGQKEKIYDDNLKAIPIYDPVEPC